MADHGDVGLSARPGGVDDLGEDAEISAERVQESKSK